MTRPSNRIVALLVVFAALAVLGATLTAARAHAVFTSITETGQPGLLTLERELSTPLWATLAPGESTHWLIRASLSDANNSKLAVELLGSGALVEAGLTGEVRACSGTFDRSALTCTGELTIAVPPQTLEMLPSTDNRVQLAELTQNEPRELLVTLTLPQDFKSETRQSARVGLGVHAAGDAQTPPVTRPSQPPLAVTGADLIPLLTLAAGLTGLGATFALRRRWQR